MKTYTRHIVIFACLTLFFCRVNAQGNQNYLTITNAPSTDTENGKVVFDNVAANATSWTWNRVIDGSDVFSRTGGDTYSPARVGKFSLVYTTSTNESYRIPFSIDIENPNPCPNSTLKGDFDYVPQMNNSTPNSPDQGKYIASILGGTGPYTYSWYFGTSGLPMGTPNTFPSHNYGYFELPFPGPYELVYLIVKDANGCSIVIKKEFYKMPAPNPPAPPVPGNGPDCSSLSLQLTSQSNEIATCDGSLQLNATGGTTPYNYSYLYNNQVSIATSSPSFSNLCAGNYQFKVTDGNGCVKELPISILANPCLNLQLKVNDHLEDDETCNGFIALTANGGESPYSYTYTTTTETKPQTLNASFSNLCAGSYLFKVIDGKGCIKDSSVNIELIKSNSKDLISAGIEEVSESNIEIYPNPFNENVFIKLNENKPTEVIISDVMGKIVFKEKIYTSDVNLNLSHLQKGHYNLLLVNEMGIENRKIFKQ